MLPKTKSVQFSTEVREKKKQPIHFRMDHKTQPFYMEKSNYNVDFIITSEEEVLFIYWARSFTGKRLPPILVYSLQTTGASKKPYCRNQCFKNNIEPTLFFLFFVYLF